MNPYEKALRDIAKILGHNEHGIAGAGFCSYITDSVRHIKERNDELAGMYNHAIDGCKALEEAASEERKQKTKDSLRVSTRNRINDALAACSAINTYLDADDAPKGLRLGLLPIIRHRLTEILESMDWEEGQRR